MSNWETNLNDGNQNILSVLSVKSKRSRKVISESSPDSSPDTLKKLKSSTMEKTDMDRILAAIDGVKKQINDEAIDRRKEIADLKDMIRTDKEELLKIINEDKNEWVKVKEAMAEKQSRTDWRLNQMEKQQKKNNLILTNYTPTETDSRKLVREIEEMLQTKIEEKVNVEAVIKIKTSVGDKVIVKMKDFHDKLAVMRKKKMMYEERDGRKLPIYVDDDLTQEDREIQKRARDQCKKARELGKVANVGHRRIYINGKEYKWNQEKNDFLDK